MRVSSSTLPSLMGTLKSTRMNTRLPERSRSRMDNLPIGVVSLTSEQSIEIDRNLCLNKLLGNLGFPATTGIHVDVNNSLVIGRQFYTAFVQSAHSRPTQPPHKVAELHYHVLPSSRTQVI